MSRFVFKFEALLKYRRHLRDLRRQMLSEALAADQACRAEQEQVERGVQTQLEEMKSSLAPGRIDIDRSVSRRYHAGQLQLNIRQLATRQELIAKQIDLCRVALVQADQSVRVLENLSEKQRQVFLEEQERKTARALDEAWMANHLREANSR